MNLHMLELLWMYGAWVTLFLSCGWAFWKGGAVERTGAAILAVCWALWVVLHRLDGSGPGYIGISIDVVSMVAFVWLAIRTRRPWVFFVAAATVNSVATHFIARWLHMGAYGYITALGVWGAYAPLLGLAFGVWAYRRAQSRAAASAAPAQQQ